jgi:lambda repressor-like predicted transcriptional regulator
MRQDLTARQRDDLILKLRMRCWPLRRIAKAVQMSPSGVAHALERIGSGRPGRDRRAE